MKRKKKTNDVPDLAEREPLADNGNQSRGGSGHGEDQIMPDQYTRGRTYKLRRKRLCSENLGSTVLSSSEENLSAAKVTTTRRGRDHVVVSESRARFLRPKTPIPVERVESAESDGTTAEDLC